MISAKIFIQQLWRLKIDWDKKIPVTIYEPWKSFYDSLSSLNELQMIRCTGLRNDTRYAELHGFADTSTVAYAAVVYLESRLPLKSFVIRGA